MPNHPLYQEYQNHNIEDYIKKLNPNIPKELKDITEIFIEHVKEALEKDNSAEVIIQNETDTKSE